MRAWLAALIIGGSGSSCVVHYVADEPASAISDAPLPPPVDFGEVDERLSQLLAATEELDQRDRLQAALQLSRRAKTDDAATQRVVLAYLRRIVAIEERARPMSAPILSPGPTVESFTPVEEPSVRDEVIVDEGGASPQDEQTPSERLDAALADGRLEAAISILESCRDAPCWESLESRWPAARDAYIAAARVPISEAYLASREISDVGQRLRALEQVRIELASLVDRFPDSPAAPDLRRHVSVVQRELEGVLAASIERGAASDVARPLQEDAEPNLD